MTKELLEKIKSQGYWKIVIRPTNYNSVLISDINKCKKIIQDNKLSLRGWDYPCIDVSGITRASDNSIHSFCNWSEGNVYEYWRFYQNGQFVHFFSMREAFRISEEEKKNFQSEFNVPHVNKFLSILSTLYSVTEIYKFASNISKEIIGIEGVEIIIELHGVKDRMLMFWDNFRRHLSRSYICEYENDVLMEKTVVSKQDIIKKFDELALDATIEIFKKFNKNIFLEDQKKLLEKRL
jgi:hypothetical protein